MKDIQINKNGVLSSYSLRTGRFIKVITDTTEEQSNLKIALVGDSTLDSGHWVPNDYGYKIDSVSYQLARVLAEKEDSTSYDLMLFAVDGARTVDINNSCRLDIAVSDEDHVGTSVNQLQAVREWQPDVIALSVGGNNYRNALFIVLQENLNQPQLLLGLTPVGARDVINKAFQQVKETLLKEYKALIDQIYADNPNLKKLVLLSQYYPSLTDFTPYFIYTGFSHVAHAAEQNQTAFEMLEQTMNELYKDILSYAISKQKPVSFVDVTSSLSPLAVITAIKSNPMGAGLQSLGN